MRLREKINSIHWAWYILAASFLTAVVSYSIRLGYGVILPHMLKSLRISKTEGGLIYSAFFFMYTLFAPIVGNLTDRMGARKVITFFCGVMALGVLLMGTVHRLETAMLFMGIAGAGISATWTPVVALCVRWFGPGRRGVVISVITGGAIEAMAFSACSFPFWRRAIRGGLDGCPPGAFGGPDRSYERPYPTEQARRPVP